MDTFEKSSSNDTRSPAAPTSKDPPAWLDISPADRLERAWERGEQPQFEAFVAGLGAVSPLELSALVQIDLQQGWLRGEFRRAEEYLSHFAPLAIDPELAVDIVYAEYLARERAGQRPQLPEYQSRFPEFAPALAEQIRFHDALEMLDNDLRPPEPDAESRHELAAALPDNSQQPDATYEIVERIGS
ncbi:MAG: hypothetical protein ACREHD_11240, partial [Pirellulales bacterium]